MSAASNPGMAPSGVAEMPSGPQPFSLEVVDRLDGAVRPHHQGDEERRARHRGDRLDRHALDDTGHFRAGAQPDIDRIGGERLLQLAAAPVGGAFDLDSVFLEDAVAHADIERHERERLRDRLADPQQLATRRRRHRMHGEQNQGCPPELPNAESCESHQHRRPRA
jgi:hypothetical protein